MCAGGVMELYVSRFLCGLSAGGSFVLVPLFVAEIAEDRLVVMRDFIDSAYFSIIICAEFVERSAH